MKVYTISDQALEHDYRGCGKAWAAVVSGVQGPYVAAIRYMDLGTANRRERSFADHREISRRQLAEIDNATVVSGMCSCTEFVA